jgi:hypothetical protein
MDLLLDRTTHDLVIQNGDLQLVDGGNWVQQSIKQNLQAILGEWFLAPSVGLPWFDELLQKGISESRVKQLLIREIVGTSGVERLDSLIVNVDNRTRQAVVTFEAQALGELITGREVFG